MSDQALSRISDPLWEVLSKMLPAGPLRDAVETAFARGYVLSGDYSGLKAIEDREERIAAIQHLGSVGQYLFNLLRCGMRRDGRG